MVYTIHVNYGRIRGNPYTLVRCPDGSGKLFGCSNELTSFLTGKVWRYAN